MLYLCGWPSARSRSWPSVKVKVISTTGSSEKCDLHTELSFSLTSWSLKSLTLTHQYIYEGFFQPVTFQTHLLCQIKDLPIRLACNLWKKGVVIIHALQEAHAWFLIITSRLENICVCWNCYDSDLLLNVSHPSFAMLFTECFNTQFLGFVEASSA